MNLSKFAILVVVLLAYNTKKLQQVSVSQVSILYNFTEAGKVKMCLNDLQVVQDDLKEILEMMQTKWDPVKFMSKMLEIVAKLQEMWDKCRSISAQDVFDYMKEEKKECFEKLDTISNDIKTIFTKQDVTLQELLDAVQDLEEKLPSVYKACVA